MDNTLDKMDESNVVPPPQKQDPSANGDAVQAKVGETSKGKKLKSRGTWTGRLDFVLALIGFSVGLGNVWRFPYLCYKNGGGAFLIPYFICLFIGGIPLLILEIGLGQYTNQGGITAWNISPIFKGIGLASVVILLFLNTYYIIIMAWSFYYMFMSFTSVLPWSHCDNVWNTPCCYVPGAINETNEMTTQLMTTVDGMTTQNVTQCANESLRTTATVEFWERKVLQIHLSDGIHDLGGMNWQLLLCLILSWVLIYLCICKGVKSSGKVVYFTATFPYVLLTILLIRAVTLDDAIDGIYFYLKPDIRRLGDSQVWMDAATQIFFSYSIGLGTMAALGSYNKFNVNFVRDAVIFACTNSGTSLYSGFVIFSVLGFMAGRQGVEVEDVATSGPGLVFIAYPEGISQMPIAPLWAILFFFMLIILGIDSQFVGVEGLVTAFIDLFPNYLLKGSRREYFAFFTCLFFCIAGLPMVTYGGMYVFQLFDNYSASGSALLFVSFFESVAIGWVYGADRFIGNFRTMNDFKGLFCCGQYLKITWLITTPCFAMAIFIFSLVKYTPLKYNDVYVYPWWGYMLGWMMAVSSMICPPSYFCYQLIFNSKGSLKERWTLLTTPRLTHLRSNNAIEEVPDLELTKVDAHGENGTNLPPSYEEVTEMNGDTNLQDVDLNV
ncbi:sodium- and chloride-dependent GABA transporter 2-like isoform X1 [Lytechinus variegatus]|uniref:sodium- and chloride-dependent GABA transporter 2-like isoform X1 n=1 Tax=Lytechinus variegatus TaxID=7654 RepID=UPI001BB233A1|nr:sodium- and chloride-dependent GABA transporter 2-like isoform X1 [Lytechinus variegatus]